ncbi:hypothetical protein HMPREF3291_00925 [Bacillus sp. HMSC76G11]|nr:hypothetical protein HMPREF3291_00925 [Bacillus sp. HMSC76G11]
MDAPLERAEKPPKGNPYDEKDVTRCNMFIQKVISQVKRTEERQDIYHAFPLSFLCGERKSGT